MDPGPDVDARVDRLERFALGTVCIVALVALLVGWIMPWFDEKFDETTARVRLVTFGFQLFDPPDASTPDGFSVALGAGFLFLDVLTVATMIMLVAVAQRSWRTRRLGAWILGLTCVCLAVVLVLSAMATGAEGTTLHVSAAVVWGVGVVLAVVVYASPLIRSWWVDEGRPRA